MENIKPHQKAFSAERVRQALAVLRHIEEHEHSLTVLLDILDDGFITWEFLHELEQMVFNDTH